MMEKKPNLFALTNTGWRWSMFYVAMGMIQLTKSGTIRKERCRSAFNNFLTVLIKVQKSLILLNGLRTCKTTQCILYHISIPILSEVTILILNSFKVPDLYHHDYNTKFLVVFLFNEHFTIFSVSMISIHASIFIVSVNFSV